MPHIKNVIGFAGQLVSREFIPTTITEAEIEMLYAAVLSHDFGLYRHAEHMDALDVRRDHARLSAIWIMEQERLPKQFARVLAAIVGAHSRGTNLSALEPFTYISDPFSANLRPQLLAAMLRVADALDIGQGRTPIAVYHHFAEHSRKQATCDGESTCARSSSGRPTAGAGAGAGAGAMVHGSGAAAVSPCSWDT